MSVGTRSTPWNVEARRSATSVSTFGSSSPIRFTQQPRHNQFQTELVPSFNIDITHGKEKHGHKNNIIVVRKDNDFISDLFTGGRGNDLPGKQEQQTHWKRRFQMLVASARECDFRRPLSGSKAAATNSSTSI